MSRHQAYRNYDYENDLDEYEGAEYSDEDDNLSPEDQAQMAAGTSQVRAALGPNASKVTKQQIEEALWHYYYDVEKVTSYLTNKFLSPKTAAPTKAKSAGGSSSSYPVPIGTGIEKPRVRIIEYGSSLPRTPDHLGWGSKPRLSLAALFHDMPWLNVPTERSGIFIEPIRLAGGLLGGTASGGKTSKLQALAAARKKKSEMQKLENRAAEAPSRDIVSATERETLKPSPDTPLAERPKTRRDDQTTGPLAHRINGQTESKMNASSSGPDDTPTQDNTAMPSPPVASFGDEPATLAAPSAFARALLGLSSNSSAPVPRREYQLPYMAMASASSLVGAFSEPSPDDVIIAAQSKASNKKLAASTAKNKDGSERKGNNVTDDMKAMKIDDTPLPKGKNLDVVREFEKSKGKKSASFVVVGHVDAGKSTLMGRLLLDLGVVDQRTIQRYRKEAESMGKSSFALAWILDQRSEERSRGVTIDIATNKFETESTSFTILDAPGHRDFIPNMIAGASQADFAILVVDAATGAFESGLRGQTREHALLLRSMGVSRIIVAINKLDTVAWSQERFDEISQQVSGFLSATGFQLKSVSYVPVSGLHGDNLVNKSTDPAASWYRGNTLIAELESSEPMARALDKPLRLTISEVFRSSQNPLTVSGRIDAGSLQVGDALVVQPSGEKAYVKLLELDSEPVDWAVAGQNIAIHLSNIDPIHVRVGDIICDPKQPIACIDSFTVKVLAFDILMPMQVDVYRGRLHTAGRIAEIPALLDKIKGTVLKRKPGVVKPASVARLSVQTSHKVPLESGQRVVLRSGGETVAAGLLE
ncbi:hypothetical protein GGS20DRAFT_598213 [Poronia punctata]|nr:hypothetical protein GGS20DRAFT_598213 [Poronia punctata]